MSQTTPKKSNPNDEGKMWNTEISNQSFKGILQTSSKKDRSKKITWGDVRVRRYSYSKEAESNPIIIWDESNENPITDSSYDSRSVPFEEGYQGEREDGQQPYNNDEFDYERDPRFERPEAADCSDNENSENSNRFATEYECSSNIGSLAGPEDFQKNTNKYVEEMEGLFRGNPGPAFKESWIAPFESQEPPRQSMVSRDLAENGGRQPKPTANELLPTLYPVPEEEGFSSSSQKAKNQLRMPEKVKTTVFSTPLKENNLFENKKFSEVAFTGQEQGHRFSFGSENREKRDSSQKQKENSEAKSAAGPKSLGKRRSEIMKEKIEELKRRIEENQESDEIEASGVINENLLQMLEEDKRRKMEQIFKKTSSERKAEPETVSNPNLVMFTEKLKSLLTPIKFTYSEQKDKAKQEILPLQSESKLGEPSKVDAGAARAAGLSSPMPAQRMEKSSYTLSPGLLSLGLECSELFPSEKKQSGESQRKEKLQILGAAISDRNADRDLPKLNKDPAGEKLLGKTFSDPESKACGPAVEKGSNAGEEHQLKAGNNEAPNQNMNCSNLLESKQAPNDAGREPKSIMSSVNSNSSRAGAQSFASPSKQLCAQSRNLTPMPGKRAYQEPPYETAVENQIVSSKRLKLEGNNGSPVPSRFRSLNERRLSASEEQNMNQASKNKSLERRKLELLQPAFKGNAFDARSVNEKKDGGDLFSSPNTKACARLFMSSGKKNEEAMSLGRFKSSFRHISLCDFLPELEMQWGRVPQEELLRMTMEKALQAKIEMNKRLREELAELRMERMKAEERAARKKEVIQRLANIVTEKRSKLEREESLNKSRSVKVAKLMSFYESWTGIMFESEETFGGDPLTSEVYIRYLFTLLKRFSLEIRALDLGQKVNIKSISILSLNPSSQRIDHEKSQKICANPLKSDAVIAESVVKQVRRKFLNATQSDVKNVLNFIIHQLNTISALAGELESLRMRHNITKICRRTLENGRDYIFVDFRMRYCYSKLITFVVSLDNCLEDIRMELKGARADEHEDLLRDFLKPAEVSSENAKKGSLFSNETVDESINKRLITVFNKEINQIGFFKLSKMCQQFDNFKLVQI